MNSETAINLFREIAIGLKWPCELLCVVDGQFEIIIHRPLTKNVEKEISRMVKTSGAKCVNIPYHRILAIV